MKGMGTYYVYLRLFRICERVAVPQVTTAAKRIIADPLCLPGNVYCLKLFAVYESTRHYLEQILSKRHRRKL